MQRIGKRLIYSQHFGLYWPIYQREAMSIIEVANLAGVSKSTVSRVINELPGVRLDKANSVRSAMAKMGYEPPAMRRVSRIARRNGIKAEAVAFLVVGRTVDQLQHMPVFPSLLYGLERALAEFGLSLLFGSTSQDGTLPAALVDRRVDGLLVQGKWDNLPATVRARLKQIPTVWIMREHSDDQGDFDHVFYNNAAVGKIAGRYLMARGHRHVAFINTIGSHNACLERQSEFVAFLRPSGVEVDSFVGGTAGRESDFSIYEDVVERLVKAPSRATGLFVPTDSQLPNLYHALELRGLRVGKDIDVISCDNERQFVSRLSPRPANININLDLVGRRGVSQLLWRIQNPQVQNRITILIEPTLVGAEEPTQNHQSTAMARQGCEAMDSLTILERSAK